MKKTAALILACAMLLAAGCAGAGGETQNAGLIEVYTDIPGITQSEIDAIEELKTKPGGLTYAHLLEMDAFLQQDGTYSGFAAEFCALMTGLFGIEFTQVQYDVWQQLKTDVDECAVAFTGELAPTAERRKVYSMTEPIADKTLKIITLTDTHISGEQSVNGMRLGFLRDSINIEPVLRCYPNVLFEIAYVDSISSVEEMLVSGQIDGFVTELNLDAFYDGNPLIKATSIFPLAYTPVSLATADPSLACVISVIDKYMAAGGINTLNNLHKAAEREYAKHRLMKSLTGEEKEYLAGLAERGEAVNIVLEVDNYPFSFYNSTENEFQGAAVDILDEIGRLAEIRFVNLSTAESTWTEIISALQTGEASVVSQLGYTKQREEHFIWSELPYSRDNHFALISQSGYPKVDSYLIPRLKIGVTANTIYESVFRDWFTDNENLIPYPTMDSALDALVTGEVDLVMCAESTLLTQINYREMTGYIVNYRFGSAMDVLFGLNKSETVLRSIIDKAQQHIDTQAIEGYWTGRVFDYSKTISGMQTFYLSVFAYGVLTVLIIVLVLFVRNLRKERRLFAARQSFQSVLDALPMPVRVVDTQSGAIVYVNDSFLKLFGYLEAGEVCGLHIMKIMPGVMSDGASAASREELIMQSAGPISVEVEYRKKSGVVFEAVVVSRHIDYKGRASSIGIIKDLTADRERERLLKESAEREKVANQAKTMFLANMSHEIRTPMNGVIGMTELLLGEELSARQLQYVKDIKISAESLLGIINDILDLSKLTEGRLQITPVDIDLSAMMKNTVSMMRFTARTKGLDFIDDVQIRTPEYVRLDDVRLKQVMVNLLSNAIKFTKTGSVTLSVKIENEEIVLSVSDTGIGIRKEELPLIFQAFEQADKRKNRAIKGTGLGLSISKNLVELMGGTISVESEYGVGTTFVVTIPYVQGDESAVETVDTVFEYISAPTAHVLLVDDIQTNLTVGAGLLRHCKITTDVAMSGSEAIELVRTRDYDIVFMDHMMPEMDGVEAMTLIRSMGEKFRDLPVIALTANAVSESREYLLSSGMSDFLSKPIDKHELVGMLRKWLPAHKVEIGAESAGGGQPEPYSDVLRAAAQIEGMDVGLALSRISGMQDVLEASIKQIAYSLSERLMKMDAALAANDLRGFGIDAHGLKGAFANIGATKHSELAAVLEIAAKAENTPQCMERFPLFASAMERFASELKAIFPRYEEENRTAGDRELLKMKLEEAISCLSNFEASDAAKCLSELESFTFGKEIDAMLAEAESLIKSFKHKKAAQVLESISAG